MHSTSVHSSRLTDILQALDQDLDTLDPAPSEVEVDLWEDARLECLNVLSSWESMQEATHAQMQDEKLTEVWHDTWFMEHMFGHLLRARVKRMMDGDEEQQVLLSFVDAAMTVQEHKQVLEVIFKTNRNRPLHCLGICSHVVVFISCRVSTVRSSH